MRNLVTAAIAYAPLSLLLAGLLVGIALVWGAGLEFTSILVATWLLVAASICYFWKKSIMLLLVPLSVAVGALIDVAPDVLSVPPTAQLPSEQAVVASGTVLSTGETEEARKCIVALETPVKTNIYLTIPDWQPILNAGDVITFKARFSRPQQRKDISGDIDLSMFYYRHRITYRAVAQRGSIDIDGCDESLIWKLRRQRECIVNLIAESELNDATQTFLAALIAGDDTMIDAGTRQNFTAAGLSHILALSGMHIAVIAMILSFILLPVKMMMGRSVHSIILLGLLWVYAVVAGMSPSVMRSVIMFSSLLIARMAGRPYSAMNALCLAAILILLFSPRTLFAPGFQLSFLAMASIIILPPIIGPSQSRNVFVRWIHDYILFSLAAVSGTTLLSTYYFGIMPLAVLAANLPCTLLLPFILGGGILEIVLTAIGVDCGVLNRFLDFSQSVISWTADAFAHNDFAIVTGIRLPVMTVVAGYLLLALAVYFLYRRRWLLTVLAIAASGATVAAGTVYMTDRTDVLFIARNSRSTSIIMTGGDSCRMVTTARPHEIVDLKESLLDRYALFFADRGIDNIGYCVPDASGGFNVSVEFGGKRLVLVNSEDAVPAGAEMPDYMVIGHGFKADVVELAQAVNPDSILLGTDINAIRRRLYLDELQCAGYRARSLDEGYGLVIYNRRADSGSL